MKVLIVIIALMVSIGLTWAQGFSEELYMAFENRDSVQNALHLTDTLPAEDPDGWTDSADELASSSTVDGDTVVVRLGKRKIVIIEADDSTYIDMGKGEAEQEYPWKYEIKPKFRGHWAGFEWGFNGFMTPNHSLVMTDDNRYLELKQGRSWNINVNFMQFSLGIIGNQVGLVTGMGIEFNDYHFRHQTSLTTMDGKTVVDSFYIASNRPIVKSKLSTAHLTVPLLLEFQLPNRLRRERLHFSAGIIGGVRLSSHTKVEEETGRKSRNPDDLNMPTFRYGFTARVGYKQFNLFANYYPTPIFEKNRGPEVYPFSVGLVLLNFN